MFSSRQLVCFSPRLRGGSTRTRVLRHYCSLCHRSPSCRHTKPAPFPSYLRAALPVQFWKQTSWKQWACVSAWTRISSRTISKNSLIPFLVVLIEQNELQWLQDFEEGMQRRLQHSAMPAVDKELGGSVQRDAVSRQVLRPCRPHQSHQFRSGAAPSLLVVFFVDCPLSSCMVP